MIKTFYHFLRPNIKINLSVISKSTIKTSSMHFTYLLKYKALLIFSCLLSGFLDLSAQDDVIGDELDDISNAISFCRPGVIGKSKSKGVLIRYAYQGGYDQKIKGTNFSNNIEGIERFQSKLKIPLINQPDLKALIGFEYGFHRFHLGQSEDNPFSSVVNRIDNRLLKKNQVGAYLTKSLDEKFYVGLIAKASFRGDYKGFVDIEDDYGSYTFTGVWGIKPREDLEWGLGLNYTIRFFRDSDQILPFLIYNQTFNDRWGIESTLPAQAFLRYNFSPRHLLLTGFSVQSFAYGIDVLDNREEFPVTAFRELGIDFGVSYEQKLFSWFWMKVDGGFNLPFRSEFIATNQDFEDFRQTSSGRPYFSFGIFITPPDEYIK